MTTDFQIPQQPPYQLIGFLMSYSPTEAISEYWVGAATPYILDGRLTPAGIMENMSQTCFTWLNKIEKNQPRQYQLKSISNLQTNRLPAFAEIIYTHVTKENETPSVLHVKAETWVENHLIASANIEFELLPTLQGKTALVIGGGVGGLFTAALLAQRGMSVTILEQNKVMGGGLACFYKDGEWWDTGIHCVQGLNEGNWCWNILRSLDINVDVERFESIQIFGQDASDSHPELRPREFLYPCYGDERLETYRQQTFSFGDQRLVGGSRSLLTQLLAYLKAHHVQLLTNADVDCITMDERNSVSGVHTKDGNLYCADVYVSSLHAKTLLQLCEKPPFRNATIQRINDTLESFGSIGIFMRLKPHSVPYIKSLMYILPEDIGLYPSCEQKGQVWSNKLIVYQKLDYDELAPWHQQRDERYYEWKEQRVQTILKRVYEVLPILESNVESYFASTSLTFRDEYHSPEGSLYGMRQELQTVYTNKDNLFLTGQTCFPHSFGNMIGTAVRTRDAVLDYFQK